MPIIAAARQLTTEDTTGLALLPWLLSKRDAQKKKKKKKKNSSNIKFSDIIRWALRRARKVRYLLKKIFCWK